MPSGPLSFQKDDASPLLSRSFVICAALTVVAGFGLVLGARRIWDEDRYDRRAYESIGRLEEARANVRNSVSNMRAFMLSTDPIKQQSCMSNLDDARDNLNQFVDIDGQSPALARIQANITASGSAMAQAMSQRAESSPVVAAKLADDPAITDALENVETGIAEQLNSQTNLVGIYREQRQDDFLLTEIAFLATMGFGIAAFVLAGIGLKQESLRRKNAEAQHANAKQDLMTFQSMLELSDQKDSLTGLLNHDAFESILQQEFSKNGKAKMALSLVIAHVDQLPQIREAHGPETCDEIVAKAAHLLKDCFRGGDICCRYNDSDFAIVLPRTNLQNANVAAERARHAIENAEWPGCNITASFGVAQADFSKQVAELVSRTEQAVDYARRTGRNRVTAIRAYLPLSA